VALAQCTHAAGESAHRAPSLPADTHAVVLKAEDEQALLRLEAELRLRGTVHVGIREPDAPWLGALMAIGLQPCARDKALKRIMRDFPLYN
jgi:hypothetical protein